MSEKTIVFEDGNAYEKMTGVWSQLVGKEVIEWLNTASGLSWVDIGCVVLEPSPLRLLNSVLQANCWVLSLQKHK